MQPRSATRASGRTVYCLNAKDGDTIWESVLDRASAEPIASSVAVVDGVAVLLADVLTGLSADTGEVLWTQEKITGRESSPRPLEYGKQTLLYLQ
jgi:outer membrane protein assembly factor BamB